VAAGGEGAERVDDQPAAEFVGSGDHRVMSRSAASRARRDGDIIEVVDADPNAFGGAPVAVVADEGGPSEPRSPRRQAPAWVVGLAVVLTIGAAGTVAWKLRPWYKDPVVIVREASVVPTLTNHLVIGTGAGAPTDSLITTTVEAAPRSIAEIGAVFVDPSAADNQRRASAIFYRTDANSANDPTFDPSATVSSVEVHGTPARLIGSGSGITVRWQPTNGKVYILQTDGLDDGEALRLANSITSDGPTVRISDRSALGPLQVLGTLADEQRIDELLVSGRAFSVNVGLGTFVVDASILAVRYPHAGIAVGTGFGPNTVEMIASSIPVRSRLTVHGRDAIEFDITMGYASGAATLTTVAWTEGGRLIAVTATSPALAEQYAAAVRPATEVEWQQVQRVSSSATAG
jgi:hypothetical protein